MILQEIRHIAMICHEANRAYKLSQGISVVSWQMTDSGTRDAVIEKVQKYLIAPLEYAENIELTGSLPEAIKENYLFCAIVDALK